MFQMINMYLMGIYLNIIKYRFPPAGSYDKPDLVT